MQMLFRLSLLFLLMQNVCVAQRGEKTVLKNVDTLTFKKLVQTGNGIILDVRTPEEVANGYIENASTINLYDPQFVEKINLIPKDKEIYVYCQAGGRSAEAAEILKENGFPRVYNLTGGMLAWKNAGYAVVKPEISTDEKIQQLSLADFKKLLETDQPVLVDFHTVWCSPCKKMAPVIDQIEAEYKGKAQVMRIDVDKSAEVSKAYAIQGVPVFMIFSKGQVVWKHHGIISEKEIKDQLNRYL